MIHAALVVASITVLGNGLSGTRPSARITTAVDTSASFSWTGSVPKGGWLRLQNLAGNVEVRRATGSTIEIHATPESDRWSWDDARIEPVRFVTQRQGSDVIVCAISDDIPRCDPGNILRNGGWDNDWRPRPMHIVVQLPAGVSIETETVHGDLEIADASADVVAHSGHGGVSVMDVTGPVTASTGHGDVHVSSAGAVRATTGHGDIVVELASTAARGTNDLVFETGHGNVRVVAPRTLVGDVDLRTGHGRVSSDFPLSSGGPDHDRKSGSAHGILGAGGRTVRLSTGHGDVSLTTGD